MRLLHAVPAAAMFAVLILGCSAKKDDNPAAVRTLNGTWIGTIANDTVPVLGAVDHLFIMEIWNDATYKMDDSLTILANQSKLRNPVETGTYTQTSTAYTFTPTSCVGMNGQLSAANCTGSTRTGAIGGNTITIAAFIGTKNLVLTKQ